MNPTAFLTELVMRLFSKNPSFFSKLQIISVILGAVSALVMYVKSSGLAQLPGWLDVLDSTAVLVGSVVATIMAQLPNDKR